MAATARGYAYPTLLDEPNVPAHLQALAEDVNDDVQELADAIEALGGDLGGGGGGGDAVGGTWVATGGGQSIPNTTSGPGTPIAFGSQLGTPSGVTRAVSTVGHTFELLSSGIWAASCTLRVQSAAAAGEISAGMWLDLPGGAAEFSTNLAHDGARREGIARTMNFGNTRYLEAGTKLIVYVFNGTGSSRVLEPNSGAWVHLDLWRVG